MLAAIRQLPSYLNILESIRAGKNLPGQELPRAARLPVAAALSLDTNLPILYLTDRMDHALKILDELPFWEKGIHSEFFAEPNPLFYEQAAWGTSTRRERLETLASLASFYTPGVTPQTPNPFVVATTRSIMARTLPRREFIKACRLLRLNQPVSPETLKRHWVDIGYESADVVIEPGTFSSRGGILDVWAPAMANPVRIEFFGDEIDTLRTFDPASQRTLEKLEKFLVTPAREALPGKAAGLNLSVQNVDEFYLPVLHSERASLLDYLPQKALVLIDDLGSMQLIAGDLEEQAVKLREESIREGTLDVDFPIPYLSWSEINDNLDSHYWVELGRSTSDEPSLLAQDFSPEQRFGGSLKKLIDYLDEEATNGNAITIVSRQVSRLKELWKESQDKEYGTNIPQFIEGTLGDGWILKQDGTLKYHLLTDSEIFGWERPSPRKHRAATAETPEGVYADLKTGDWVVHIDYGIGRYIGLVQRTLEGVEREYLEVEYDGGDQVFVPVHQADRLSRYIGPDNEQPTPTRLGTAEWNANKERAREAVLEVARELLELYALRQVAVGFSFKNDTPWQQELEASFPYFETRDQLLAINEVKKDMESQRPMDRLLCGDVGYGKTEVALRAAFKAVMDGKQVAVLVPTTVLAQQHFETFRQRLAAFPVQVEMLSRFRNPKEQDDIIKRLREGMIDIVIGTHRLVQSDVLFKDLGLVIIDEEQRFGVTHKEHFKKLRTELDVLTLTATPIPRTLYMAMTGVRDISTINTPPEERQPTITHIGPYSTHLVRQAILRELERGGQVFFVHNRVQTIHGMQAHLHQLVPEARVKIAHGQMPEGELSNVMTRFTHAEVDVLLCTSIIESGLDIPNANTLIVDRGDTFGLAQLYQLRGRVGRSAQRAYAYFFRHRRRPPTPEGMERLEVIAENTQLGTGYSIAMRDLEMRGAGEMLGKRQHGFIAAVGFHLYTRLLAQAVRNMRQIKGLPETENRRSILKAGMMPSNVELPLPMGIPSDYVQEQNMRLRLYRRLSDLQGESEMDALEEEFLDRFGPLPDMVKNLFYQMRVKLRSERAGIAAISKEADQLVLRYSPLPEGIPSRKMAEIGGRARTGKNAYWIQVSGLDEIAWKQVLLESLSAIIGQ